MFIILEKITFINEVKEGFIYKCKYETLGRNGQFLGYQLGDILSEHKIINIEDYIKEYNESIYNSAKEYNECDKEILKASSEIKSLEDKKSGLFSWLFG